MSVEFLLTELEQIAHAIVRAYLLKRETGFFYLQEQNILLHIY